MYLCKNCVLGLIPNESDIIFYFNVVLNKKQCEKCGNIVKVDWIQDKELEDWKNARTNKPN